MNAFNNFMTKAAELYLSAPTFFNWAAPLLLACIGGLIWLAYWLGGKLSEARIEQLKGKVEVLEQRFEFARDKADAASKEAADTKAKFEAFTQKIDSQAPREVILNAREAVGENIDRLLTANSSTTTALEGVISAGFDEHGKLKWRPMTQAERIRADMAGQLLRPGPSKEGKETTKPST